MPVRGEKNLDVNVGVMADMGNNSVVLPCGFTSGLLRIYWDQTVVPNLEKTAVFAIALCTCLAWKFEE